MADLGERIKTDVRIPASVAERLDDLATEMGISKNAVFTLGVCLLSAQLAGSMGHKQKRSALLDRVQKLFQKTLKDARNI